MEDELRELREILRKSIEEAHEAAPLAGGAVGKAAEKPVKKPVKKTLIGKLKKINEMDTIAGGLSSIFSSPLVTRSVEVRAKDESGVTVNYYIQVAGIATCPQLLYFFDERRLPVLIIPKDQFISMA